MSGVFVLVKANSMNSSTSVSTITITRLYELESDGLVTTGRYSLTACNQLQVVAVKSIAKAPFTRDLEGSQ